MSSDILPDWAPSSELFSSGCTIHGSLKQQTKRKFRIFSVHACKSKKKKKTEIQRTCCSGLEKVD